jgi:DNA-binding HxlR family transcriptional regulator
MASCKHYPGMATLTAGPRSGCPINAAVEVIGDRWSLLVPRDVMFGNRRPFRVLQQRSEEGIASNILADRLRRLVRAGLLTRADVGRGRRATYSLTEAALVRRAATRGCIVDGTTRHSGCPDGRDVRRRSDFCLHRNAHRR